MLLLEDIDCAFPSQDEDQDEDEDPFFGFKMRRGRREGVTMSICHFEFHILKARFTN